jgi:hypothetical protein
VGAHHAGGLALLAERSSQLHCMAHWIQARGSKSSLTNSLGKVVRWVSDNEKVNETEKRKQTRKGNEPKERITKNPTDNKINKLN